MGSSREGLREYRRTEPTLAFKWQPAKIQESQFLQTTWTPGLVKLDKDRTLQVPKSQELGLNLKLTQ